MTGIAICGILVVLMLAIPLVGAALYCKTHQAEILNINHSKVRDARYFGKSFAALVESHLDSIHGNTIKLSREENFIDGDTASEYPEEVEQLVISRKEDFRIPPEAKVFLKEIYTARSFYPAETSELELRAAYSRGKMILPAGTQVIRWVDSEETLAAYDGCDLGHSASAGERMCIGQGCKFHRLYAPEIYLGQYPDSLLDERQGKDPRIYRMGVHKNHVENIRYISDDMINEEGVVDFTVIAKSNLEVLENLIVNGDIRSHKGVRLYEGAVVCGNIFAEQDIHLGKNSCVLGNIFSQGDIYIEEGAAVGQKTRICSVIARGKITFEKDCFVFGYVDCEIGGEILPPPEEEDGEPEKKPARPYVYLPKAPRAHSLSFKDADDFNNVDAQGFRYYSELREVVIPDGVTRVPNSMFYSCASLEQVRLPSTIEEIGDYAFAGCRNLKSISLGSLWNLKRIGTSAFENCAALESVDFPGSLKTLGGAAFSGCSGLRRVTFGLGCFLPALPDHCFRGCVSLREITLPKSTRTLGVSAFLECPFVPEIRPEEELEKQLMELDLEELNEYAEV